MKTIIQVSNSASMETRQEQIKHSILVEMRKPFRESDSKAQEMVGRGSHVYCPKSLRNGFHTEGHYINTEIQGSSLVKIF